MSKRYTQSKIFCSCSGQQGDIVSTNASFSLPVNITHNSTNHEIGDLFFCPTCMGHKCKVCCQVSIESKYCSNCMTDFTDTRETFCTKNCFSCPLCDAGLAISAVNSLHEDEEGKIFKFRCLYCSYRYTTATILKPKSLVNIIKSEKRQKDNGYAALFARFFENYVNKQNLMKLEENHVIKRKDAPLLSKEVLQKFRDLKLSNLTDFIKDSPDEILLLKNKINQSESVVFNEHQDLENALIVSSIDNTEKFVNLDTQLKYSNFNSANNNGALMKFKNKLMSSNFANQVPIPKRLSSKVSYRCLSCERILFMPQKDPTLIKALVKWNAIDFTPTIRVSSLIDKEYPKLFKSKKLYNLLLNIVNPLATDIDMVITSMPKVPLEFFSQLKVQIALPVTNLKIGGNKRKKDPNSIIKSIPTAFLTSRTKLSRAELIMRLGKLNSTHNFSDDSLEISELHLEKGDNWCLVPVSICVESSLLSLSHVNIKVPFYLTIKSQVPESFHSLNLPLLHLSYGYWSVIDFGLFFIEA